jgi:hypothetical protein
MQELHDYETKLNLNNQNNVFPKSAQVTGNTYVADGIIRAANMEKK